MAKWNFPIYIKDAEVRRLESDIRCSCCGSSDLYEGYVESDGPGNGIVIKDCGDGEYPLHTKIQNARCCRRCGNVMMYVIPD